MARGAVTTFQTITVGTSVPVPITMEVPNTILITAKVIANRAAWMRTMTTETIRKWTTVFMMFPSVGCVSFFMILIYTVWGIESRVL